MGKLLFLQGQGFNGSTSGEQVVRKQHRDKPPQKRQKKARRILWKRNDSLILAAACMNDVTPTARVLLIELARVAGPDFHVCMTMAALAKRVQIARSKLYAYLQELVDKGFVSVVKQSRGRAPSAYQIHLETPDLTVPHGDGYATPTVPYGDGSKASNDRGSDDPLYGTQARVCASLVFDLEDLYKEGFIMGKNQRKIEDGDGAIDDRGDDDDAVDTASASIAVDRCAVRDPIMPCPCEQSALDFYQAEIGVRPVRHEALFTFLHGDEPHSVDDAYAMIREAKREFDAQKEKKYTFLRIASIFSPKFYDRLGLALLRQRDEAAAAAKKVCHHVEYVWPDGRVTCQRCQAFLRKDAPEEHFMDRDVLLEQMREFNRNGLKTKEQA